MTTEVKFNYTDEQLAQFIEWAKKTAEGFPLLKDIYEPWKIMEQMFTDLQSYRAEEKNGPCKHDHPKGWFCSAGFGHEGACPLWPVSHDAMLTFNHHTGPTY